MTAPHDPAVTADATTDHAAALSVTVDHAGDAGPPADLPAIPGHRVLREIARGGMGRVLAAFDDSLGREVAIKTLLPGANPDRFVRESKITARLPHPGIPPVHALGVLADGSPFLTMKLIVGHTLSDEIKSADRPRLLQAFARICEAVGFAHSRGVVHRDLKPSNVMVGAFGEVQVMDWGLAKDLADRDAESTSGDAPAEGDDRTQAGQVLGTPAYMAPEQARGETADARSDVFALGGILCAVLTGKPPFVGSSVADVIRMAGAADLAAAHERLSASGADADLVALCRRCLAPNREDRPADGRTVADAVTAYLDGVQEKLRLSELAQAEARVKAAGEAKRRRLATALAATVLLAVTTGGGAWLWWKTDRDAKRVRLGGEIGEAYRQASSLADRAKAATAGAAVLFAQAREQAQRAGSLAEDDLADAGLRERVRELQTSLDGEQKNRAVLAAIDEAHLAQGATRAGKNEWADEAAIPLFRRAFADFGIKPGEGEPLAAAERVGQAPADVRDAILGAIDEWLSQAAGDPHRDWLRAVADAAEPADSWRRKVRAAKTPADLRAMAKDDLPNKDLAALARRLEPGVAAEVLRKAYRRTPGDFWVNQILGRSLLSTTPPKPDDAVRHLTASVALRPESPGAMMNLANALRASGRNDEAMDCYRKALELDGAYVAAMSNLSAALQEAKRFDEAVAVCTKAVAASPGEAHLHNNLGAALYGAKRVDAAIESYRKSVSINPAYWPAHLNLGVALRSRDDKAGAVAAFRKTAEFAPENARAHVNLGDALAASNDRAGATRSFRRAVELDPRDFDARLGLGLALAGGEGRSEAATHLARAAELAPREAVALDSVGVALVKAGRPADAAAVFVKALALSPDDAKIHFNLGVARVATKDTDGAMAAYAKAADLDPKNAEAHNNLADLLSAAGKTDEAVARWRKAVAADPKLAIAHVRIGVAMQEAGRTREALASFEAAMALEPDLPKLRTSLGIVLYGAGKRDEAVELWKKAVELDPKDAQAHFNLGFAMAVAGRADDAVASLRKAAEADPKKPDAHGLLGVQLFRLGKYAESRDASAACLKLLPADHPQRPRTLDQLRRAEAMAKIDEALPKYVSGEAKPASPAEGLDVARVCAAKKAFAAAARFAADALAAKPELGDDMRARPRYDGACWSVLAAAGRGTDAAKLDDKERARLRAKALEWLRADLKAYAAMPDRRTAAQRLSRWRSDADLASVRDDEARAKLPEAERKAFAALWAEVAEVVKKGGG